MQASAAADGLLVFRIARKRQELLEAVRTSEMVWYHSEVKIYFIFMNVSAEV